MIVRPWNRKDRSALAHWPKADIPAHWSIIKPASDKRESWAIELESQLVGRISLRDFNADSATMGIYLHPGFYGRGIGSSAMAMFLALAPVNRITIDCASDNDRAIKLYVKSGFRLTHITPEWHEDRAFYLVHMEWKRCTR